MKTYCYKVPAVLFPECFSYITYVHQYIWMSQALWTVVTFYLHGATKCSRMETSESSEVK